MSGYAPIGGRLFTKPFGVVALIAMVGFAVIGARFLLGIGWVSNLNDGYPWGIWIVIDVMIGTAISCAGYSIALLVYLLNRGEYHPLMRPALLAALFGYTLAGFAVMIDLGRYWQVYTLFWPSYIQPNSVMLEVALCVMAYVVVLWIEFTPAVLERFGFKNLQDRLSRVLFFFIALGLLLPTMHQSSLGTLGVVAGYQISPLWQTQLLPPLFLISAILMGYAIVPFESTLASLGFKRRMETAVLGKVSAVAAGVTVMYLMVRFADLVYRGALPLAFAGDTDATSFWIENALFVLPVVLLAPRAWRTHPRAVFVSAIALLLAGSLYRFNVYLIGYHPVGGGWRYFPAVSEMLITLGVFAFEVVLYLVFVKNLPVLHRQTPA